MGKTLLTRTAFRESVFARDGHKCVVCKAPAQDAHHLIERRLWTDGGYYRANGVSLCGEHHLLAEQTVISVEELRALAGIQIAMLPDHFYRDQEYDKWGNQILQNGQRLRGELFYDPSVQKVLMQGGVLGHFTNLVKYPRTYHVPWSENITEDDRVNNDINMVLQDQDVVVTEKMDGEKTTLYRDYIHARSVNSRPHESQTWVKDFWSRIAHDIPPGWRICGENLYAKHSIPYKDLPSYFMGFSIWDHRNFCLPWDDTLTWFELLGITPVPFMFWGVYSEKTIRHLWKLKNPETCEGYVIRPARGFAFTEFRSVVGKYVRKDHVLTVPHWRYGQPIVKNEMKKEEGL